MLVALLKPIIQTFDTTKINITTPTAETNLKRVDRIPLTPQSFRGNK